MKNYVSTSENLKNYEQFKKDVLAYCCGGGQDLNKIKWYKFGNSFELYQAHLDEMLVAYYQDGTYGLLVPPYGEVRNKCLWTAFTKVMNQCPDDLYYKLDSLGF